MAIIQYAICIRNVWKLGRTLNYINILQPIYFNVFLHGKFLQCTVDWILKLFSYLIQRILSNGVLNICVQTNYHKCFDISILRH